MPNLTMTTMAVPMNGKKAIHYRHGVASPYPAIVALNENDQITMKDAAMMSLSRWVGWFICNRIPVFTDLVLHVQPDMESVRFLMHQLTCSTGTKAAMPCIYFA